jgi:hypothetical protein
LDSGRGAGLVDGSDGLGDKQLIQSELQVDLQLIVRYGEEHPETWAGAWFDNEPTVRIVAAFTGDVAQHDAALRPRVAHPDRLAVQRVPHSLSSLRQIREEIERTLQQLATETGRAILSSVGLGMAVIHVALRADQEDVAGELAARYGNAVELRVGAFKFPESRRRRPRPPGRLAPEEVTFEGLEVSVETDQKVLEVGDDGRGRLVLLNSGSERIGPLDYPDHHHPSSAADPDIEVTMTGDPVPSSSTRLPSGYPRVALTCRYLPTGVRQPAASSLLTGITATALPDSRTRAPG